MRSRSVVLLLEAHGVDVLAILLEIALELLENAGLELAGALAADTEEVTELLQGQRLLRDETLVPDLGVAALEGLAVVVEALLEVLIDERVVEHLVGQAVLRRDQVHERAGLVV